MSSIYNPVLTIYSDSSIGRACRSSGREVRRRNDLKCFSSGIVLAKTLTADRLLWKMEWLDNIIFFYLFIFLKFFPISRFFYNLEKMLPYYYLNSFVQNKTT